MAIFTPSSVVGKISGSVGGQTFVNAKGSKVVRRRPARRTNAQPQHPNLYATPRTILQIATNYWRSMDEIDRDAWRTAALLYPATNRLGQKRPLNGYQLFIKYQLEQFPALGVIDPNVPILGTTSPVTAPTFSCTEGGPYTFNATTLGWSYSTLVILYGRNLYAPNTNQHPKDLVLIEAYQPTPLVHDVQPAWDARLPPLRTGMTAQLGVRIIGDQRFNTPIQFVTTTVA